ncbi:S8 family serine peptidase [Haladaptatus sp. T7]|uniref:S8 family peptidase n=1 Tax=Haladaptatus sp. T7 TaxID=2029368 RepID=UPI0022309B97|nr:S8 family serine peptidase [Haladaptatus sp. T7]
MSQKPTRRSFLKGAGVALAGLTMTVPTISASSSEDRYILDLRSVSESDLADVEVVHRLDQIDIAVVRADDAKMSGTRYSKDVEMTVTFPEVEHHGDEHDRHKRMSDPLYRLQWDKQAQDVARVHRRTRGEGTRVSVIDSGAFEDHPDLQSALNTDLSKNFTDDGGDFNPVESDHGTHCSGIIAADDRNGKGVTGTAPGTDLVALRVFSGPTATFGDIIAAMVYSGDIGSDAANMSLGAYPMPKDSDTAVVRDAIERAASYANEQGTLVVAAAGNDSANLDADGDVISLPNEADNVMSISATGPIGYRWDDEGSGREKRNYHAALHHLRKPTYEPAFYTNYGAEAVDISAPGGNADQDAIGTDSKWYYDLVLSTVFTESDGERVADYGWKAGTSMASPQVAAVAALVKSVNPDATPGEVREHLEATARDLDDPTYHGEGHLDTARAVWEEIGDDDHDHGRGHGHGHDDDHDRGHGGHRGHDDDDHDGTRGHGHDD